MFIYLAFSLEIFSVLRKDLVFFSIFSFCNDHIITSLLLEQLILVNMENRLQCSKGSEVGDNQKVDGK